MEVFAGSLISGFINGDRLNNAKFSKPLGLTLDLNNENLYVADSRNFAIRKINILSGIVSTIIGNGSSTVPTLGVIAANATLGEVVDLSFNQLTEDLMILDHLNNVLLVIPLITGKLEKLLDFTNPFAITVHQSSFFISDENYVTINGFCSGTGRSDETDISKCDCLSGWTGDKCEIRYLETCTIDSSASLLNILSNNWPIVDQSSMKYQAETLSFKVDAPLVNWRYTSMGFLNGANCPDKFIKNVNRLIAPCGETFNIDVDFANRTVCGFTKDNSDTTYLIWKATTIATLTELIGVINGNDEIRVTKAKQTIAVRFPRSVQVTAVIANILSGSTFQSAVIYSDIDYSGIPNSGAILHLTLVTSIGWPFKIDSTR